MDQEEQLLISIDLLVIILWFVKLTFINKKNYEKNLFSAILRYSSFASLIVAIIAILLKFIIKFTNKLFSILFIFDSFF